MQRRTLLQLLGVASAAGSAGCLSRGEATDEPHGRRTTGENDASHDENAMSDTAEAAATEEQCPDGLVTHTCHETVEEAVERIQNNVEESPLTLVTTIDHAENAASVDEDLPPTTLLVFGNPEVGTPLMQESRTVAIDLPQKMLVWEDGDRLQITYNDPRYLARRHGIDGQEERIDQIATVLEDLATSGV